MSFKRLDQDDFVVSADAITSTLWSGDVPELTTFFTSSLQKAGSSGDYYLNSYNTVTTESAQFAIAYGNKFGSGSVYFNNLVTGSTYSKTIFGQYRALVLEDENSEFIFGNYTASEFHAISIERARYKESLFPGSFNLKLSSSAGELDLTDNSVTTVVQRFIGSSRVFDVVSGSNGSPYSGTGFTAGSGSYGMFLPDYGLVLLNSKAISSPVADGGIATNITASSVGTDDDLNSKMFDLIKEGASFKLNSQETITSDYVFVRPRSSEFNYSENPTYISGSTGEILYSDFITNPQSYITTVGLYNDNNDLLAIAKLSKPLKKDFTKEALIRVKLDF